jgi:GT2 family glycosyltransferase
MYKIAVLLTCYNRKDKTLSCLDALFDCSLPEGYQLTVYLVDDGSTDGTGPAVLSQFPTVHVATDNGSLFWAGGMRLAWRNAIAADPDFNYFLLLNDDTILLKDAFLNAITDLENLNNRKVILVGSTYGAETNKLTYGGRRLFKRNNPASAWIVPNESTPQKCDLGNANVMFVSRQVVDEIGILSDKYTHGIADYDYSMRASANGVSVFVASKFLGYCENEHGNNWLPVRTSLKDRINYLYNVKGLAYNEYVYYIKSHFPSYILQAKAKLWLKTFFPIIWDKLK